MAGRKSKQKGYRYERKIATLLNKCFGTNKVRRTPASGGLGIKGDLCTLEGNFELPGPLSNWCLELKCQERPRIWDWITQARNQAGNKKWALIFSKNFEEDIVAMSLHDWIELLKENHGL